MKLNLETAQHPALVLECTADGLRFASGIFHQALIIHYRCEQPAPRASLPESPQALRAADFDFLAEHPFEIMVLGTGAGSAWLAAEVSAGIEARRVGLEIAPTRSASYIFNVLLSEGRRVAAVMYPPGLQLSPRK